MPEDNKTAFRLSRMRTLSEAYECIKAYDPATALSANFVRCLIVSGAVPRIRCGKKYLVDVDVLIDYLNRHAQGND